MYEHLRLGRAGLAALLRADELDEEALAPDHDFVLGQADCEAAQEDYAHDVEVGGEPEVVAEVEPLVEVGGAVVVEYVEDP